MKLAVVFRSPPHGSSVAREGLDVLLSATAFFDEKDIGVFFIDDGILNLLPAQQPHHILQKDFTPAFSLLDLCDITQRFLCQDSKAYHILCRTSPLISATPLSYEKWRETLCQAEKILTF